MARMLIHRDYSPGERLADAILHIAGVGAALVAAPLLIVLAVLWRMGGTTVAAVSIYAFCLLAMFCASAGYNLARSSVRRDILRRLDHAAIYLKIAGTYTPFAVLLGGPRAPWLLGGIWAAAAAGLLLTLLAPRRFEWASLALYLAMGWAVVVVGGPVLEGISTSGLVLMMVGGGLYTVGVLFHLWNRLPFQNAIWHFFVLAASFAFYAAVVVELARAG